MFYNPRNDLQLPVPESGSRNISSSSPLSFWFIIVRCYITYKSKSAGYANRPMNVMNCYDREIEWARSRHYSEMHCSHYVEGKYSTCKTKNWKPTASGYFRRILQIFYRFLWRNTNDTSFITCHKPGAIYAEFHYIADIPLYGIDDESGVAAHDIRVCMCVCVCAQKNDIKSKLRTI